MNWISTLFIFLFGGYIFNFVELSSVVFLDPYHKKRAHELAHDPPVQVEDEVNDFTSSTPNPPQGESKPEDDVFNYNCALLTDAFLFFNFLDAIKEGDGSRIMRQYKYIMLYCKSDGTHSTKYALECLYQFFLVHSILSQRDSERFTWNRSVNYAIISQ